MKLKTKLKASFYGALYDAYCDVIEIFIPDNEHEDLLLEHAKDLCHRMGKKLLDDQQKYMLTLTSVEALAFIQWWGMIGLEKGSLKQVCVAELIKEIDLGAKSPKRLQHG